jgi:serine/threonine-protein kinase
MSWNEPLGRTLAHYDLLAELARGGAARVYRAFDTRERRDVAIKVISTGFPTGTPADAKEHRTFVTRFERAVAVALQLRHPHIVAVYDAGATERVVYLVMRLCDGGSLRRRLDASGPLPVGLAARYGVQMARALDYAHQRGILQHEVKPAHMLLAKENPLHLLLSDFGSATILRLRHVTSAGIVIGAPEYMSPEQAAGKESDPRSDIYSLGVVLYEMLTGRPPFMGQSPIAIMYQHVHVAPASLRGDHPQVPGELWQVIETALRKQPDERYPTAAEFATALEPFVGDDVEG